MTTSEDYLEGCEDCLEEGPAEDAEPYETVYEGRQLCHKHANERKELNGHLKERGY